MITEEIEVKPTLKAHLITPQDQDSRNVRRLEVEHMLLNGKTYKEIEHALTCSSKLVASVAKEIVTRNDEAQESVHEILKTRLLATASKALTKVHEGLDTEQDLKVIQGIFNSTYDRATGTSEKAMTVNIQLANMFSLPTQSQATEKQ